MYGNAPPSRVVNAWLTGHRFAPWKRTPAWAYQPVKERKHAAFVPSVDLRYAMNSGYGGWESIVTAIVPAAISAGSAIATTAIETDAAKAAAEEQRKAERRAQKQARAQAKRDEAAAERAAAQAFSPSAAATVQGSASVNAQALLVPVALGVAGIIAAAFILKSARKS